MSFEVLAKQNEIDEEHHKSIEEGEAKVKTDTASGFINGISASMQKTTVDDYVSTHENAIANVDKLEELVKKANVISIETYKSAFELKGLLSSLFCYTFNNKKDTFEKVSDLEDQLGHKIGKFAKNYGKASKDMRPAIKYLLWNRRYASTDYAKVANDLIKAGHLWKNNKGNYFVTGLHLAVGDNTFTYSRNTGKEYRNYVKVCAIQCFYVTAFWQDTLKVFEDKGIIGNVPLIDETIYHRTSIGDYKGSAKISFCYEDRENILKRYMQH